MKTGIWIDRKKAVIVVLDNDGSSSKTMHSEVDTRTRIEGEGKDYGRFGDQFTNHEKANQRRREQQEKEFVQRVAQAVKHADELLVFGPAGMKHELKDMLEEAGKRQFTVITADSMTDPQVAAMVRDHFSES